MRRYSANPGLHAPLESNGIEGLWLTALFAFDQRLPDVLDGAGTLLLAADEVADQLTVVGIAAAVDLSFDPCVLLISEGDGLAYGSHVMFSSDDVDSYYWCHFAQYRSSLRSHLVWERDAFWSSAGADAQSINVWPVWSACANAHTESDAIHHPPGQAVIRTTVQLRNLPKVLFLQLGQSCRWSLAPSAAAICWTADLKALGAPNVCSIRQPTHVSRGLLALVPGLARTAVASKPTERVRTVSGRI